MKIKIQKNIHNIYELSLKLRENEVNPVPIDYLVNGIIFNGMVDTSMKLMMIYENMFVFSNIATNHERRRKKNAK